MNFDIPSFILFNFFGLVGVKQNHMILYLFTCYKLNLTKTSFSSG